jgi:hypothetical protein
MRIRKGAISIETSNLLSRVSKNGDTSSERKDSDFRACNQRLSYRRSRDPIQRWPFLTSLSRISSKFQGIVCRGLPDGRDNSEVLAVKDWRRTDIYIFEWLSGQRKNYGLGTLLFKSRGLSIETLYGVWAQFFFRCHAMEMLPAILIRRAKGI